MFALLRRLEAAGHLRVCTSADEVETAVAAGVLAAVPHLEGAEAIVDLDVLEVLHALGLRSLGPVWSRPNAFATGVPFAFPGSADVGTGLTAAGRALVDACDRLRILLDVSHLNAAGFWELLERSTRPVVASHSNVHALSASPRNLSDDQLAALAERDGLVGLNFAVGFLREDGKGEADTPLETMVRHRLRIGLRRRHHAGRHRRCQRAAAVARGAARPWLGRRAPREGGVPELVGAPAPGAAGLRRFGGRGRRRPRPPRF